MGLTYEQAKRLGIEGYWPTRAGADAPGPGPRAVASKRKNKYGNVRTIYNGITYDSKAEAARAGELDRLRSIGAIRGWARQVTFALGCPENTYRADFLVFGRDGIAWAEDVKGVRTSKFVRDMRLWRSYGPCALHVISKDGTTSVPSGRSETED